LYFLLFQLAEAAQRLLDSLPLGGGRRVAGGAGHHDDGGLRGALAELRPEERRVLQAEVETLTGRLRVRLDERIATVGR